MATNAIILIAVAATGALALAGMVAVVVGRTRTRQRDRKGGSAAGAYAFQLRPEVRADVSAERARDAMIEIENGLQQREATSYRSEAVTSRDQLNEHRVHRLAG